MAIYSIVIVEAAPTITCERLHLYLLCQIAAVDGNDGAGRVA